jgi:CBS domain-containing protein
LKRHADVTNGTPRIKSEELAGSAMAIMRQFRIDELPVVDENDKPSG